MDGIEIQYVILIIRRPFIFIELLQIYIIMYDIPVWSLPFRRLQDRG